MERILTFHHSSIGHLHILKNTPCQDYSLSYQEDDCVIAVVADGHGETACCRSDFGSQKACELALEQSKIFVSEMKKIWEDSPEEREKFTLPKQQKTRIRTLTDSILAKWQQEILQHLKETPLTEKELSQCQNYRLSYEKGEKLAHIYGTTLIVSICFQSLLVLFQQGDGHCNIFYQNQELAQPIPWDERCHENITTSLCDEDASNAFRSCVIDLEETPVIGCFLASDGVEDSFRNVEGNYIFYKQLLLQGAKENFHNFVGYLTEYFPQFSETGSGDDISVAGWLVPDGFTSLLGTYEKEIELFALSESLTVVREKLNSMERKHLFLLERKDESTNSFQEYTDYHKDYLVYQGQEEEIRNKMKQIEMR